MTVESKPIVHYFLNYLYNKTSTQVAKLTAQSSNLLTGKTYHYSITRTEGYN